MTPEQLAAIRERANNATKGPWVALGNDIAVEVKTCTCAGNIPGYGHEQYCGLDGPLITGAAPRDAEFIAAARTDIPALLDHIQTLTEILEAVRGLFPGSTDPCPPYKCTHVDCEIINTLAGDPE